MRFFAWCWHVWNITIWVFLGHFCCISLEILEWKFFKFVKMDQNLFHLIKQASAMSKIKLSVIVYACCLNKTTKTMNKLTNEQPSSHFFLTNPLHHQQHQQHQLCESARFSSRIMIFCFKHFLESSSRLLICCLLFTFHFWKFRRWIYFKATNFTKHSR